MRRFVSTCVLYVIGSFLFASSLRAQEPISVVAEIPECLGLSIPLDEFERLLRIELRTGGLGEVTTRRIPPGADAAAPEEGAAVSAHAAVVVISSDPCEAGASSFIISIQDNVTRKRVERTVDLSEAPSSTRPRAIALAAAELLLASWAELALASAEPPSAPGSERENATNTASAEASAESSDPAAAASSIQRVVARRAARAPAVRAAIRQRTEARASRASQAAVKSSLFTALDARFFSSARTQLLGPVLFFQPSFGSLDWLRLRFFLRYNQGENTHRLGDIRVKAASAGIGFFLGQKNRAVSFGIEPRIEVGSAWSDGVPASADIIAGSGSALFVAATGAAVFETMLADPLRLQSSFELGYTLSGLDAEVDGAEQGGVSGVIFGGQVALGVAF